MKLTEGETLPAGYVSFHWSISAVAKNRTFAPPFCTRGTVAQMCAKNPDLLTKKPGSCAHFVRIHAFFFR
jgi:hypothetical protein